MRKKFYYNQFNPVTNKTRTILTEKGKEELRRLESIYLPMMKENYYKNTYQYYSGAKKLKVLIEKDKREKTKMQAQTVNKVKKVPFIDYLASHPTIEWLDLNYKVIEDIEKVLWSYLDDIETAKELIIEDIVKKELAMSREENNSIKYAA